MNSAAACLIASLLALPHGDKPPKGPPWKLDYWTAKRHALHEGKPIFVYFTKTV